MTAIHRSSRAHDDRGFTLIELLVTVAVIGILASIAVLPRPPLGWSAAYTYTSGADGNFMVSATGDGTTARVP